MISIQDLENGERNLHVKLDILGSGADESAVIAETALNNCGEFRLDRITSSLDGFRAYLTWEGATPVRFLEIPDDVDSRSWRGGLKNPKVANYSGDVSITTENMNLDDVGTVTLEFVKKDIVIPR